MSTDNGGPAFPQPNHLVDTDRGREQARDWMADSGMTLLDWFAGQALAGLVSESGRYDSAGAASDAYSFAAAMLAEKRRREQAEKTKDTTATVNAEIWEPIERCVAFASGIAYAYKSIGVPEMAGRAKAAIAKAKGQA